MKCKIAVYAATHTGGGCIFPEKLFVGRELGQIREKDTPRVCVYRMCYYGGAYKSRDAQSMIADISRNRHLCHRLRRQ